MRTRVSSLGPVAFGLLLMVALGTISARPTLAADPVAPTPYLFVYDAPFVRTTTVELAIVREGGLGGPIAEFRASNDPTTVGGVLVNGVAVTEVSQWALAPGPDGPRTVYGQVHYTSGLWSSVASLALVLDASPGSTLSVDLDPIPAGGGDSRIPPDGDWHRVFTSPEVSIVGITSPPGIPTGFEIIGGGWFVYFWQFQGPIVPGAYEIPEPIDDGSGSQMLAALGFSTGSCRGPGTIQIHEITFTPDGDIASVSADFRLVCFGEYVASGSIRYGSDDPVKALDPSIEFAGFGETPIGVATPAQVAAFQNDGSAPVTLGDAVIEGADPGDFEIISDSCSGVTLGVGQACAVSVRARPSAMSQRSAYLRIPDTTPHGRRQVWMSVYGLQQTTVTIEAEDVPEFGPATATFVVTTTPDADLARFVVTGADSWRAVKHEHLTGPSRSRITWEVTLAPGPHDITATIPAERGYLASQAEPVHVDIGIGTKLALDTTTDDGVAAGEAATLVAKLDAGATVPGGTLRIRDGVTNAVLATKVASGVSDTLLYTVTRGLGTHPLSAEYVSPAPNVQGSSASYDLTVVSGPRPETTMSSTTLITNQTEVTSTFASPDVEVGFQCRVNASQWFTCTSPSLFRSNQFGANTISVRAIRASGLADRTPSTRSWILDWTAPTAVAPTRSTPAGRPLRTIAQISTHFAWGAGADAESGVTGYDVELQIDGRAYWERIASATKSRTLDVYLYANHGYRARVRAINGAGTAGEWASGPAWWLSSYHERVPAIRYSGSWVQVRSGAYLNDLAKASSTAGAKATFTYTGRTIALISRLGPTRGRAAIYVDGVYAQTIDLYARTYQNQRVVWSKAWSTPGRHTVTIKVMGTKGRPRVEIDGFICGS